MMADARFVAIVAVVVPVRVKLCDPTTTDIPSAASALKIVADHTAVVVPVLIEAVQVACVPPAHRVVPVGLL